MFIYSGFWMAALYKLRLSVRCDYLWDSCSHLFHCHLKPSWFSHEQCRDINTNGFQTLTDQMRLKYILSGVPCCNFVHSPKQLDLNIYTVSWATEQSWPRHDKCTKTLYIIEIPILFMMVALLYVVLRMYMYSCLTYDMQTLRLSVDVFTCGLCTDLFQPSSVWTVPGTNVFYEFYHLVQCYSFAYSTRPFLCYELFDVYQW